ncbi:MAG: anti-sigma factor family protein [Nitrososphaerales archaeon]
MTHLTDEQLNEYLDNESTERVQLEAHLSSCDDCATRLTALQALFAEIESLPELELTQSIAARFDPSPGLSVPQLPRWLTLTETLQAAIALISIILAAPMVMNLLPAIQMPSLTNVFIQVQSQWAAWLDMLSQFQVPVMPEIPVIELSSLVIAFTLVGVSLLWLVGNGLLLRNQIK